MPSDRLRPYRQKRDFRRTPEPAGRKPRRRERAPIFVVQEHAARRHHYDVRLEIDGVLVSWAVPKGPSADPRVKRMAVPTEDHPLDYADFEGTIPEGEYGGGHVLVWDRGTWTNVTGDGAIDARTALEQGHLVAELHGSKLQGAWVFQRIRDDAWLMVKRRDAHADPARHLERERASVISGHTLDDLATGRPARSRRPRKADDAEVLWFGRRAVRLTHPDKVLFPADGLTKRDLVEHAVRVAPHMLPHTRGRAASLQVWPDGIDGDGFYLKRIPAHAPDWLGRATLPSGVGPLTYVVLDHVAALAWIAGQNAITPHVSTARVDRPEHPDRLVFDLDPATEGDAAAVREGALWLRDALLELDLVPFVMTTGSRGLHVHVPLDRHDPYDLVRAFAADLAACLAAEHPDTFTVEVRKNKRAGRVFVDVLRNAYGHTTVAPWSVRALPGAPVATPLDWSELEAGPVDPRAFTLRGTADRLATAGDPWKALARRARRLSTRRPRLDRRLARCRR